MIRPASQAKLFQTGAYLPGGVVVLPGNTTRFHRANSSEYVTQVTAISPISLRYVNPEDDPRPRQSRVPARLFRGAIGRLGCDRGCHRRAETGNNG